MIPLSYIITFIAVVAVRFVFSAIILFANASIESHEQGWK